MRRLAPVLLLPLLACGPYFYEAPPSLDEYPDRVGTKRWQDLLKEVAPLDPAVPSPDPLEEILRAITAIPGTRERLAEISRLLGENRRGIYSSDRANFLRELEELAGDNTTFQAAGPYLAWRVRPRASAPTKPMPERFWKGTAADLEKAVATYRDALRGPRGGFEREMAGTPAAIRPHWQVQFAAFLLQAGEYEEAAKEFSSVVDSHPTHPRAEVALLMNAFCRLEQARRLSRFTKRDNPDATDPEIALLQEAAESGFKAYLTAYPKGRFASDAEGWLGAIDFDRGLFGSAVRHQVARLDMQPTREVTRTVLRECGMIFGKWLDRATEGNQGDVKIDPARDFDAAAVARHPLVVRLFIQYCVDPAAHQTRSYLFWDDTEEPGGKHAASVLAERILTTKPAAMAALSALGEETLRAGGEQEPLSLLLLAWAGAEEGRADRSIELLDQIPEEKSTDDSLHMRGILLQRVGRHEEAVRTFDALASSFPESGLKRDLPFRRSISLFRSGQEARAIRELAGEVFPEPTPPVPDSPFQEEQPLHLSKELLQWLDTMIQFSPVEQLEAAAMDFQGSETGRKVLKAVAMARSLGEGRFREAAGFLIDDGIEAEADGGENLARRRYEVFPLTRPEWEQRVRHLEELHARLESADPNDTGTIHLAIARKWMEQRGSLTMGARAACDFSGSEGEKLELQRKRNALHAGFKPAVVDRELDSRDEATHALEHALKAAESNDPATAAAALELANECLFRRAEFSLYANARAMETNDAALSRKLHDRLLKSFPTSDEARRAAVFVFTPHEGPWMPGDYNPSNSAFAAIGSLFGGNGNEGNAASAGPVPADATPASAPSTMEEILKMLDARIASLPETLARMDPVGVAEALPSIRQLDDLKAAASLPGITVEDYRRYEKGERQNLPEAFASLLGYQQVVGTEEAPSTETVAGWKAFLEKWPDSPRAEAASFRMTRLIARNQRGRLHIRAVLFPEAAIPAGYKRVEADRTDAPRDPAAVFQAIAEHEKRFPKGRYQNDINLLKAGAFTDAGDVSTSLPLIVAVLKDPGQRDLQAVATLEFMDAAQRLLDTGTRGAAATAFRQTPGAIELLKLLVRGDTFLCRLKPMMAWLEQGAGEAR